MTALPPTTDEVMQNNDPEWFRDQADKLEVAAHEMAEELRKRADSIEFRLRQVQLSKDKANIVKAMGASEIRLKQLREQD
jgi:hypothetical protein